MSNALRIALLATVVALPSACHSEGGGGRPAVAAAPAEAPTAFLTRIYQPYTTQDAKGLFQMNAESLGQFFEKRLGDALLKNFSDAKARGLQPSPKGDAFVNAYLWHISALQIGDLRIDVRELGREGATGKVAFTNFGIPKALELDLVVQAGGWRISDIRYGPKQSLRRLLGLEPGDRAEQATAEELAARFNRAVLEGDLDAVAAMIDPSGLVGHDPLVSGREQVLKALRERRGRIYTVLLSSKEERAASGDQYSPAFMSQREFFGAHPDLNAKTEVWGISFIAARWSLTEPDPNKWPGPVVIVARDFLGQAWIRGIDDAMD